MLEFLSQKLSEDNKILSQKEKNKINIINRKWNYINMIKKKFRFLKKFINLNVVKK